MEVHKNGAMNMRKRKNRPPKPGAVTVIKTDAEVWQVAIRLAGGDFSRIEIVSESTVIVHNRNIWRHPFRRARSVIAATEAEGQITEPPDPAEFQPTIFEGWWDAV